MSPVHNHSSYSCKTSTKGTGGCCCGGSNKDYDDFFLPIKRRGNFFQDSIFENTRSHFDSAIRDVLDRWGDDDLGFSDKWDDASLGLSNNLGRYRRLRSTSLTDDNQAVKVTSDNDTHKIVLDVKEFMAGDIRVQLVGDKEVVVEGRLGDNQKEDSSSFGSQSFRRRFSLPELTNVDEITSVMSLDGILTITAPQKGSRAKEDTKMYSSVSDSQKKSSVSSSGSSMGSNTFGDKLSSAGTTQTSKTSSSFFSNTNTQDGDCHCDCCKKRSFQDHTTASQMSQREGESVPIKINASSTTANRSSMNQEMQQSSSADVRNKGQDSEANTKKVHEASFSSNTVSSNSKAKETNNNKNSENRSDTWSYEVPIGTRSSLPVTRRGDFFNDSFFTDVRQDYRSAIKDVLSKWGDDSSTSSFDDLTSYRKLRSQDLREENQAVKSIEDDYNHRFILDVHDFVDGGEINVQAIDDKELVIEGRVDKQEGSSKSTKRFRRSFLLPGDIKLESVTSVMSADGVLTIIAPKKPSTFQLKEMSASEKGENLSVKSETRKESVENFSKSGGSKQTTQETSTYQSDENKIGKERLSSPSQSGLKTESERSQESTSVSVKIVDETPAETHSKSSLSRGSVESSASQSSTQQERYSSEQRSNESGATQKIFSSDQMRREHEQIIPVRVEFSDQTARLSDESTFKNNICSSDQSSASSQSRKINNTEGFDDEQQMLKSKHTSVDDGKNIEILLTGPDKQSQVKQQEDQDQSSSHGSEVVHRSYCEHNFMRGPSSRAYVPLRRRGRFYNDSVFEDSYENFEIAISDVLNKFNAKSSKVDDLTSYRKLRQQDCKLENQAFHVEDNLQSHKVVLDVQDFLGGEIKIAINEGKELIIEGQAERREETSMTTLSFLRRFVLPPSTDVDAVTAFVSIDGVLIVISPKRETSCTCGAEAKALRAEIQSESGRSLEDRGTRESSLESQASKIHTANSSYRESSTFLN